MGLENKERYKRKNATKIKNGKKRVLTQGMQGSKLTFNKHKTIVVASVGAATVIVSLRLVHIAGSDATKLFCRVLSGRVAWIRRRSSIVASN